ncbi:MAG: 4Fe-4S binding protein [Arcobacter sp.]|uniref:4Fe-4S binding protein n=1 Tax=Arcobacter sp. TaxID=1872629 RepID=UPI003D033B7D
MAKKQILAPTLFITFCLYVLFPWLSFNNIHFLMFNFEFHRFEFLFMAFEASTHQLIYIVVTLFIGLLLGLNLTISRFYCGYFCPSTIATFISLKFKNPFFIFGTVLSLAFVLAFSTISYFTSAIDLFLNFTKFDTASIFVGVLTTAFTSIFLVFRGWYCSILCPYFFVSAVLPQEEKQTFEFFDKNSCIDCDKCVKVCPIDELDIKAGFDMRCVQCGLCETACDSVMIKFNKSSLIKKKYKDRNIFRSFSKNGYIWGIIVFTIMIFTIIYILDSSNLDNCYFINKNLY